MDTGRGVLNTGVNWGEKGRASGVGSWGGIAWGKMTNVVKGRKEAKHTAMRVLCNCLACSAHVPQNLKCNKDVYSVEQYMRLWKKNV